MHGDPDALVREAQACCRAGRLAEGAALARRAIAADPHHVRAHVLLGMALAHLGQAAEALTSFDRAIALAPHAADAYGNRGDVLAQLGRPQEAVTSYRHALELAPDSIENWCNLGAVQLELGQTEDALASYDRVVALDPGFAEAHTTRGHVLALLGRHRDAVEAFDRALALAPAKADALIGRADALKALARPQEALASLDAALAADPANADALSNRGFLLHALGRLEEALGSIDRALNLDPGHRDALINRGVVLADMGRTAEALVAYDRALVVAPEHAGVHCNRGKALFALQRFGDALAAADRALAIDGAYAEAHYLRGTVLTRLRRYEEAITEFERVLVHAPGHPHAAAQLASCCLWICDWQRLERLLPPLTAALADGSAIASPHILLQLPLTPAQVFAATRNYVEREIPETTVFEPVQPRQGGRIRVAYLSGDFRVHPVAYLAAELFERHDRGRFEIIGLSFGPDDRSALRARLIRGFDQFFDLRTASDRDVAQLIRKLGVDIAVDMGGHTENARPAVLRPRPAPVQVQYLGFAGTMGVDFIDYIIADPIVLPFDQQPFYTEKIVHLPDCFMANDSTRSIAQELPTRQQAGLPARGFVFCCFNNSYKISSQVFEVWLRLLAQQPDSVLWLSQPGPEAVRNLQTAAASAGIDPRRIVFAPRVESMAEHLARHRLADLFLDTPGYNAHTTASDALWAGLPVLTCAGSSFAGRVAASLLHSAGLPELVTESIRDYETLALKLARERELLAALRDRLLRSRTTCALFDIDRFRRHLECAYLTMWRTWQRGEPPHSFAVEPIER